ncbi:MAG TPA: alpha/beta fold hydrolase [Flavobacteriales bacterium]|nr:alpha/beta fold hydrolase [Flavobacteriales bacterium]
MRLIFLFILAIHTLGSYAQTSASGHYEGAVSRLGSVQLVKVDLKQNQNNVTGTYDIPELGYFDCAITNSGFNGDTLIINLQYGVFKCLFFQQTGEITGLNSNWGPPLYLHLKKYGQKEKYFSEEELNFSNGKINLSGVLFKPVRVTDYPIVIMVHGSGAVDRNAPYYHSLGYALAQKGIGVFLYDKRGNGKSTGNADSASMYDLAGDALAAMQLLKSKPEIKNKRVGFMGISQGGWIVSIAANKTADCAFVILNVGPAVSVFEQDLHRVKYSMLQEGWPATAIDSAVMYTTTYFEYAQTNSKSSLKKLLAAIKWASNVKWKEFINVPKTPIPADEFYWWRNNNYDPAADIQKFKIPVLSILGEKDELVPPAENKAKMDSLLRISKTRYQVVEIPGVGHDKRTFQGLNGDDWKWPTAYWQWRKQPESYLTLLQDWILQL